MIMKEKTVTRPLILIGSCLEGLVVIKLGDLLLFPLLVLVLSLIA